jgi:lipopolysaccharide export system protein LptC
MTLHASRLFPLALALALALLTMWLEHAVNVEVLTPTQRRHDPDYFVERMRITRYDAAGRVEAMLAARKMVHYPDDDSTELLAPQMVQTKPNQPRLTVTAERGTLSQDGEEVFLHGNVLVVRERTATRPEARIRTEFLHLVQGQSLVRTDREVLFTEARRELSGRGMEYHNDTGALHLRERVRGRLDPAPRADPAHAAGR